MKVAYFTERPYRWIPEDDEVLKNHAFFAVSNKHFDREKAADDYNYFLDEYCYAEELGFDAVALNEHHGNPFCMGGVMNVEASILARVTSKAKIVLIGNPLRSSNTRCVWQKNWRKSTSSPVGAWSPAGCGARAASNSSTTTPTQPTTGRCSTRRMTSSRRRGRSRGRGAMRGSISTTAM